MATSMDGVSKSLPSAHMSLSHEALQSQPNLTASRRTRPHGFEDSVQDEGKPRVPLKQPKVERRQSKGGLRGLFTRSRMERLNVTPVIEENTMPTMAWQISNNQRSPTATQHRTDSAPTTPTSIVRPDSHIKGMSPKVPAKSSPRPMRAPKTPPTRTPTRTSTAWDPPPLFQAYPQAVKHTQLSASTLSADTILRINNQQKLNDSRADFPTNTPAKKPAKSKSKHQRQVSGSLSRAEWTQKIFVLVTSGYLLQYAGDGSFDRLPEKMMQLGQDSVAFASDVIPGKHWVLQISQSMDSDGTPAADTRSFFSRLAFRGADYRRTATSLLLVFNNAEDMDSWLAVVRREIEALGGKKHVSETGKPKIDDKIMKLEAQPSHRYQVTRDPDQASNPPSPRLPPFGPPPWIADEDDDLRQKIDEAVNPWTDPPIPTAPSWNDDRSVTNSVTSQAERQLDALRDGSNRLSYMSSGQRTTITSEGNTPSTSPTRTTLPGFDDFKEKTGNNFPDEEGRPRPNASAIHERRRSMQTIHKSSMEVSLPKRHYRHSTYVGPSGNLRSASISTTPNFSVPNSSSKRWSSPKFSSLGVTQFLPAQPLAPPANDLDMAPMAKITELDVPRPLTPIRDATDNTSEGEDMLLDNDVTLFATKSTRSTPEGVSTLKSRRSSLVPVQLPQKTLGVQTLRETKSQHELRQTSLNNMPALSSTPEYPYISMNAARCSIISPIPATANTKIKLRRPISMQVSASPTPFSCSPPVSGKLAVKPTTPPGGLSLFPPTRKASVRGRSPSPAFNDDNGMLTAVTILSPVEQKHKLPYLTKNNNSNASLAPQRPKSPYLNQNPSSQPSVFRPRSRQGNAGPPPVSFQPSSSDRKAYPSFPNEENAVRSSLAILPQKIRVQEGRTSPKTLGGRRSMPSMLVNGPPLAPPPDCALPPLPPGTSSRGNPVVFKSLRI